MIKTSYNGQRRPITFLEVDFERWATAHKFNCDFDDELQIYISAFTQGAFMAYKAGVEQQIAYERSVDANSR